ncbi:Sec63 Brl domain-domain-containing protein [Phakopsora pachyrhizi]|uniref:Sec63 Brl domain-domain-containing protein n=1 Tax=Phakopsora pachyrhizi TaxID=170000 RepID=A0AAV0B3E1_PHAPC|nr:Sec63 Brl domain-domain-containing protein [Phakopsora pachyrhizi]
MSGADSVEFDQIKVRESEAEELEQLEKEAPCQVEGGPTSTPGKVNILLQAYISRLHIEDFALISDTAYVVQNAARIARALVDIGVWKKLADTACVMIEMAKCIDSKIAKSQDSSWLVNHSLPELKKTESGMLMKTIQDLIGHKLERNFDGDEDSVEKVRQEKVAGQDNQLKTCEVQEMVMKFSEVVRRFDNSLPGRIQFLAQEGIEELKTEDGGMVLNAARHNELVRGHLNKLS